MWLQVKKFANRLHQLGICFKKGEYYLVIYDFLVRFHGRQNEIWFVADRCLDTAWLLFASHQIIIKQYSMALCIIKKQ